MNNCSKNMFKNFPALLRDIENNNIRKYTSQGTVELSDGNMKLIHTLQKDYKKSNLKVICILSCNVMLGESIVDVDDYVYLSNGYKPEEHGNNLLIYSACHNKTWGVHEIGLIEIIERNGIVERIF